VDLHKLKVDIEVEPFTGRQRIHRIPKEKEEMKHISTCVTSPIYSNRTTLLYPFKSGHNSVLPVNRIKHSLSSQYKVLSLSNSTLFSAEDEMRVTQYIQRSRQILTKMILN
jgi:hypothetical protein